MPDLSRHLGGTSFPARVPENSSSGPHAGNPGGGSDPGHRGEGQIKITLRDKIIATDIRPEAIQAARQNAGAAGVESWIEFGVGDFAATPIPEGKGVVILNPEYGERLGRLKELGEVYKGSGEFFKIKCQGYRGFIFTGNLDLAKKVGLKARRRIPFFNSNIECRLLEYELYEGSRRGEKGFERESRLSPSESRDH